ncbi:hypothetical protein MtrunA17_Chr8g0370411 [Medicago truncatula]|uniref:Transmembrane protein n=1 Tax=Medicago truncatula TaxID=3880 RepID=A0A396GN70_MEDTR|nr:hypothetical protein MtrunA17_Chr8g0370411 [Medicago truncatula]
MPTSFSFIFKFSSLLSHYSFFMCWNSDCFYSKKSLPPLSCSSSTSLSDIQTKFFAVATLSVAATLSCRRPSPMLSIPTSPSPLSSVASYHPGKQKEQHNFST